MENNLKSIRILVLTKIFFSIVFIGISVQCIGQPDCVEKTGDYIMRLKGALASFIPDPGNDKERDQYLETLRHRNPLGYQLIERLSKEANLQMQRDSLWLSCFQQEFLNVNPSSEDENIIRWSAHLFKRFSKLELVSPEFEKGFGIHLDVNQGAADLGQDSEAYSFAARILMAYTFSKDTSGGRLRILGGVSTYYFDSRFSWFVNPRLEYRIIDIGNELTSLGSIKAIADANFGKTWIAGVGVGLELHDFGIQVLYERQGEIKSSHLLVGIFYRFLK